MRHPIPFMIVASLALATSGWGAPTVAFQGAFELNPTLGHPAGKMTGTQTVLHEGAAIASVQLDLDAAVFGKKQYLSKEQFEARPTVDGKGQLNLAYKLQGPPHKWYYVLVSDTVDGGITFLGKVYKVDEPLAQIQAALSAGVRDIPATWKLKGSATLKKVSP